MPCRAVTVGSKSFTENVILAEIISQMIGEKSLPVVHRNGMGGTRILWEALLHGDIDIYPEYSGTLIYELLSTEDISDFTELRRRLVQYGIGISDSIGFNNTYVLGMPRHRANTLGIKTIADLVSHPGLRFGFSNEFMARRDGWPGLRDLYNLLQEDVRGIDHDLAYRGLAGGTLDVIDLYATDAEISYYDIQPLVDNKGFFPEYQAVFIYREGLLKQYPELAATLSSLNGRIDDSRMAAMNAAVKLGMIPEVQVAADFINQEFGNEIKVEQEGLTSRVWKNTIDHMTLVVISLSAAILISVPLGIIAFRIRRAAGIILGVAGIIQTIPSLALLVFMIPLLGVGGPPAVLALFLYSLLPIVRNTYSGLQDIPRPLIESAIAMGLPPRTRLRLIELPLAARSILSGIKISAVINVGTATLGGLIGAGGYGQPILTGIRLNDMGLILEGAVPAALLALLVQGFFEFLEHRLIPRGLKA